MNKFIKSLTIFLCFVCAISFGVGYYNSVAVSNTAQEQKANISNNSKLVALGGTPFGMKIFTKGVMVVGVSDVETKEGLISPAEKSGVKIGDIIIKMNDISVYSNADVSEIIENSRGKKINLKIKRNKEILHLDFYPEKSKLDGLYKAGLWVRDSSAGIGTMTFYMPETKVFAGLGHAVCDVDTGNILPISDGEIVATEIYSVNKSKKGDVGELCGCFLDDSLGKITKNTSKGVYGRLYNCENNSLIEIAPSEHVKVGYAQIFTTIKGKPKYYDCYVENVSVANRTSQNMIIKITDKRLLNKTGGIVQGMSGSPIVQNGKLIGAVTHVLVDNPEKGYGIFAEDMLKTAQGLSKQQLKEAS